MSEFRHFGNGTSDHKKQKKRRLLVDLNTPKNVGKLTSETTFGHAKVFFRPVLRIKYVFSQNPLTIFPLLGGESISPPPPPPSQYQPQNREEELRILVVGSENGLIGQGYAELLKLTVSMKLISQESL